MANRAQPFNARALRQMGVPPLDSGLDGRGIVIGFVDYGFDILHPCLREAGTGNTRLKYLWDQNSGRQFDTCSIGRLIFEAEQSGSRQAADAVYDPHANYFSRHGLQSGAHGTLICSIAAGSPVAGFRGVAPAAQIIAVQLGLLDHHWKEEDPEGRPTWTAWQPGSPPLWDGWRDYGEAPQIVGALDFIHDRASRIGARGLVINLSIGAYTGAHDGSSAVERKISELVNLSAQGGGLPCAVVVSAGNAGIEEGHFGGEAKPGHPLAFEWRFNRDDATQNKLEIWYRSESPLEIGIAHSDKAGTAEFLSLSPGRTHAIEVGGARIGIAEHIPHLRIPLSCTRILLHPPYMPEQIWPQHSGELSFEIRCEVTRGSECVPVHAWLERDDGLANRSTLYPSHPTSTLSGLAAADGAIVVAGYDHHSMPHPAIFPASSLGPLPWSCGDADQAPHVGAPGDRIWGARSKSPGFIETSGTSAAAALTSGAIALLMQRFADSRSFSPRRLIELLTGPDRLPMWSPRFGCGAVNIAHILGEVTA